MVRPLARQKEARWDTRWRYLILDGYVDEPAALGVPPYISPQARSIAGGLVCGGAPRDRVGYLTVDQWRMSRGKDGGRLPSEGLEAVIILSGCVVPGKYLRGTPISRREVIELVSSLNAPLVVITGSAAGQNSGPGMEICQGDPGVMGEGISASGRVISSTRSIEQWNTHLKEGAFISSLHPDHPSPLICEIETSSGCPRFISGGCSFCMEPGRGPVRFREPYDIATELRELASRGVENVRIGGQSDLMSYLSPDVGRLEVPRPDPEAIRDLMTGVRSALHDGKGVKDAVKRGRRIGIDCGIIHTDNANPSVIAAYPETSLEALSVIAGECTSGSVLALGLESSDPDVKKLNNLNSDAEEVEEAVRLINRAGGEYGDNGLPRLLPGLNFLGGLPGQTPESFEFDLELLGSLLDGKLMLRRINIRKALFPDSRGQYTEKTLSREVEAAFGRFRKRVRDEYDRGFLSLMLPPGHVLKGVMVEAASGHVHFGRQIGSYPLLVGVEHRAEVGEFIDVAVTDISSRSVTGFSTPFFLDRASFSDLLALPGIGRRRAAELFRSVPEGCPHPEKLFPDHPWVLPHLRCGKG